MSNVLNIGTRRSALAKAQTNWVIGELARLHPTLKIGIVEVVTTGDRILDSPLSKVPGKGVFVKEIEDKLLSGEIDLAVHSMKDLPTEFPDGLKIGAVPERVDPRDAFISGSSTALADMPRGARIGTSSLRRQAQLLKRRPDLEMVDIRGNIDTRLRKAETDEYDGIVLATAGLQRMGWVDRIQETIALDVMIPAVGQGAIGIEIRANDSKTQALLDPMNDEPVERCVNVERAFLATMGGGCQTPMGAYCENLGSKMSLRAFHANEDGSNYQHQQVEGPWPEAIAIAEQVARHFRAETGQ